MLTSDAKKFCFSAYEIKFDGGAIVPARLDILADKAMGFFVT